MKAAFTKRASGSQGYKKINDATKGRSKSARNDAKLDNNWIPTDAVLVLTQIQQNHKGLLSERAMSDILSELNMVWRTIMR